MTRKRAFATPPAAAGVVQRAKLSGWGYSTGGGLSRDRIPFYRVTVARPATPGRPYVHAVLVWHMDADTHSYKLNTAVYRTDPRGPWETMGNIRFLVNFMHTGV